MTEVKFIRAISSGVGAFRRNQICGIPEDIAKQWIASGHCEAIEQVESDTKPKVSKGKKPETASRRK